MSKNSANTTPSVHSAQTAVPRSVQPPRRQTPVQLPLESASVNRLRPKPRQAGPSRRSVSCPQDSVTTASITIPSAVYILGGWALAAIAFFGDFSGHPTDVVAHSFGQSPGQSLCQQVVQPNAALSREDLAELLTVPERASKNELRDMIAEPYCQLSDLEVRADAVARREAYPLAFDPDTWLVVLYESEEYAGYAFHFSEQ